MMAPPSQQVKKTTLFAQPPSTAAAASRCHLPNDERMSARTRDTRRGAHGTISVYSHKRCSLNVQGTGIPGLFRRLNACGIYINVLKCIEA